LIIGYTTGVFDMFHIGHLNVLRRSRALCDYLIVGVSTDELVTRDKYKSPIIPFDDRVEIIKSIRYVDEVVPQLDKDKLSAYIKMEKKFNKMFVGSDWQGTPEWNKYEEQFKQYLVSIVYLPHTDGISSTDLRLMICK
jgi:glycerol-3-phosphate cytidylyltransferase